MSHARSCIEHRFARALAICVASVAVGCAAPGLLESPADAKVSAAVRSLLEQSPALDTPNLVSVQTHGGVVYLRGLVATPYQIAEAGALATHVPGVSRVANLLSIDNAR